MPCAGRQRAFLRRARRATWHNNGAPPDPSPATASCRSAVTHCQLAGRRNSRASGVLQFRAPWMLVNASSCRGASHRPPWPVHTSRTSAATCWRQAAGGERGGVQSPTTSLHLLLPRRRHADALLLTIPRVRAPLCCTSVPLLLLTRARVWAPRNSRYLLLDTAPLRLLAAAAGPASGMSSPAVTASAASGGRCLMRSGSNTRD